MARIGILTISDGRRAVSRALDERCRTHERRLAEALAARGHELIVGGEPITTSAAAVAEARRLDDGRADLVVINLPVWAFPHFTVQAARELRAPLALFSALDPQQPGMVAMLAAGGALDQLGMVHARVWGEPEDPSALERLEVEARAGAAVSALVGSTFGRIGGRPMGMYTAVSDPDEWIVKFGVDVEEIDQLEIVRRAGAVDAGRVTGAREWLERHANVHYDGSALSPETLERQIRAYHAMRDIIAEYGLAFSGIKAQPELTEHYGTMDVVEAFLNDPYDWEGPKAPHVCATEADMDGALTMRILHLLSATPVLFADMRHFHADVGVWDLCNSGQHATWFAARSDDPVENLRTVHLYPEVFFFPAGGASVHHVAAPGEMTFARLTRLGGRYRMQVIKGRFERFDAATDERLMRASTYEWPHAFARLEAPADEILTRYGSNHIHAVPGDHVAELRAVCRRLDVDFDGFGSLA